MSEAQDYTASEYVASVLAPRRGYCDCSYCLKSKGDTGDSASLKAEMLIRDLLGEEEYQRWMARREVWIILPSAQVLVIRSGNDCGIYANPHNRLTCRQRLCIGTGGNEGMCAADQVLTLALAAKANLPRFLSVSNSFSNWLSAEAAERRYSM